MKPIGPLMWEHRLIEQIIPLIQIETQNIRSSNRADVAFIEKAVDFFRTYADRTHHGKEEDILFAQLNKKTLPGPLATTMKELMDEHVIARKNVLSITNALQGYISGRDDELGVILTGLTNLIGLYPGHIEKEDKNFFFPAMDCFSSRNKTKCS